MCFRALSLEDIKERSRMRQLPAWDIIRFGIFYRCVAACLKEKFIPPLIWCHFSQLKFSTAKNPTATIPVNEYTGIWLIPLVHFWPTVVAKKEVRSEISDASAFIHYGFVDRTTSEKACMFWVKCAATV